MDVTTGNTSTAPMKPMNTEFTKLFQPGTLIEGLNRGELRELAKWEEARTDYGSASYISKFKSRSAAFTRTTVEGQVTDQDRTVIEEIQSYLKDKEVVQVERQMCQGPAEDAYVCRLWVTKPYARLAHMFHASLGPVQGKKDPDFFVVDVPEYEGERRILVDPDAGVTYVLGSDYYGEIKKAFLRMTMYRSKEAGGLGLHAGSKEVWARSAKTKELVRSGMLFFGLSGTGKTSLTCHDYDLNMDDGEKARVRQDDVVLFKMDGSARGTEVEGFYIKTEDLSPKDQKALYEACISPDAIMENVWVHQDSGKVDFYNSTISKNGRAVVPVRKVINTDGDIDMPLANKIFFITRHSITPPIAKLSPEQAAIAFMLGESIKTSAADPNAKGEAVREVGTNPFIVGSRDAEGNRFYEILKANPEIECFLINTGKVGQGEDAAKIGIMDTVGILRAVAREGITWKKDEKLRLEIPKSVDGLEIQRFEFENFFSQAELEEKLGVLRGEREKWLDQFPQFNSELRKFLY